MRSIVTLRTEADALAAQRLKAGVTTEELDRLAHDYMVNVQGTIPAPLNYAPGGHKPYPKSICTSINHQVCHGIPNDKPLKKGDIMNIDVTVITKDGWYGDNSRMYLVGDASIAAKRLCGITYEAMWHGIVQVKPGARLGDIGWAIQRFAESNGYSVVRDAAGHVLADGSKVKAGTKLNIRLAKGEIEATSN